MRPKGFEPLTLAAVLTKVLGIGTRRQALEFLHDKLGVVISRRLIDTPQSRRSDVDALVGSHIHCG